MFSVIVHLLTQQEVLAYYYCGIFQTAIVSITEVSPLSVIFLCHFSYQFMGQLWSKNIKQKALEINIS